MTKTNRPTQPAPSAELVELEAALDAELERLRMLERRIAFELRLAKGGA